MTPENPINAIDIRPAVTSTIAEPLKGVGISLYSIFSRIPAIMTIEMVNPTAVAKPLIVLTPIP